MVLENQATGCVGHAGHEDRDGTEQGSAAAAEVKAHESNDPNDSNHQANKTKASDTLLMVDPDRQNRRVERSGGDEDARECRRDLLLPPRDQRERDHSLDKREHRDRAPAHAEPAQCTLIQRKGKQHERCHQRSAKGNPYRREIVQADLDQQV